MANDIFFTTREEIEQFCFSKWGPNFKINNDNSVEVFGPVDFSAWGGCRLPFKFTKVHDNFYVQHSHLETFEGFPTEIVGLLNFRKTNIISFQYGPEVVCGDVHVNDKVTSMKGCPKVIGGMINLSVTIDPWELRYLLLSRLIDKFWNRNLPTEDIINSGRIGGVIPSELIPGKIQQLKELSNEYNSNHQRRDRQLVLQPVSS